ncbi:GIY-YIG nuclease family protein [Gracilimonas sp.]|uniref:GIY-YIG nuclease family protein n=1 Tax=Gracilimonas sp. TaxID=1974203 RepID=UPI003D0E4121
MHQTYIIYSENRDRYYIGSTSVGVAKRVERHNAGWSRSTKSGIPWVIKYVETFATKLEALAKERHIKKQKSLKVNRIRRQNLQASEGPWSVRR